MPLLSGRRAAAVLAPLLAVGVLVPTGLGALGSHRTTSRGDRTSLSAATVTKHRASRPATTPHLTGASTALQQAVAGSLAHSSATHADWTAEVSGLGTIGANADVATAPASNEKLFTAITLLKDVGPTFRYHTQVLQTGTLSGGTLDGDLVIVGSGDPTLSDAGLAVLARDVRNAGIRRVTGHLIAEDTRYSQVTSVTGWKHGFVPEQSGTVDAFSVDNDNWRGGSSFLADPTSANLGKWRSALTKAHVTVAKSSRVDTETAPTTLVTSLQSRPLSAIINMTLTYSINYYAEMMLREAGAQVSGTGTPASGIAAIKAAAKSLSLPFGTTYDGSGLSNADRQTPATILAWLEAERSSPSFSTFEAALPRSCEAGTLSDRLCGKHLTGAVMAKTGTLDHVRALSGYTTTRSGRLVTFSFLLSGIKNMTTAQTHLDAAVADLVNSTA